VFGSGTLAVVRGEVERLAIERALVLTTPYQVEHGQAVVERLGDRAAGVFHGAMMHTPVEVTMTALAVARECSADGVIAVGGGSTIGPRPEIGARTRVAH